MSIIPQVSYGDEPTLPKRRVYFDYNGSDALVTGSLLCYDVSALATSDQPVVVKPLTADLSAIAGVYVGDQGASIAEDRWIEIVPADAYGSVVSVLAAADDYDFGDAIAATNDSYAAIIPQDSGDVVGDVGRDIAGFLGIAVQDVTLASPGLLRVLITR